MGANKSPIIRNRSVGRQKARGKSKRTARGGQRKKRWQKVDKDGERDLKGRPVRSYDKRWRGNSTRGALTGETEQRTPKKRHLGTNPANKKDEKIEDEHKNRRKKTSGGGKKKEGGSSVDDSI